LHTRWYKQGSPCPRKPDWQGREQASDCPADHLTSDVQHGLGGSVLAQGSDCPADHLTSDVQHGLGGSVLAQGSDCTADHFACD